MAAFTASCIFDRSKIITMILFKDVKNTVDLRKKLLGGEIEASLIKPTLVLDKFQVLVAANKALLNEMTNSMMTRNIGTEVIYNLSCIKNIKESLATFGIAENDTNVLAVAVDDVDGTKRKHLLGSIDGNVVEIEELNKLADESLIKLTYKIKEPELQVGTLLEATVSRIATKDFISF